MEDWRDACPTTTKEEAGSDACPTATKEEAGSDACPTTTKEKAGRNEAHNLPGLRWPVRRRPVRFGMEKWSDTCPTLTKEKAGSDACPTTKEAGSDGRACYLLPLTNRALRSGLSKSLSKGNMGRMIRRYSSRSMS